MNVKSLGKTLFLRFRIVYPIRAPSAANKQIPAACKQTKNRRDPLLRLSKKKDSGHILKDRVFQLIVL